MEKIQILIEALEYIDNNLTESINTEEIANYLYCSKSTIEKLFKYVNNMTIRDYIIRRRMSKAAIELTTYPERTILDIGIQYGYGSNEAYTRAFHSIWQVSPSEFRKNPSNYELFPGYKLNRELMEEDRMKDRKKIDISELYDCIKGRSGCYLVLEGKSAVLIALYPTVSLLNPIKMDSSTMYLLNHMHELGYNDIRIVNLFSKVFERKPSLKQLRESQDNISH